MNSQLEEILLLCPKRCNIALWGLSLTDIQQVQTRLEEHGYTVRPTVNPENLQWNLLCQLRGTEL